MAEHKATLKYLRIAPRKARLIAGLVRGLPTNEAEARLLMSPNRASKPILKLLRSAVRGASDRNLNVEKLYISEIRVDQGPMLKRFMMRARGGSSGIQKKTSHIILALSENPNQRPGRFTIAVEKKSKAGKEAPKKRAPRKKPEGSSPEAPKKKGVIARRFSRKTEGGE